MTAGARIDDGGEVWGNRKGVAPIVFTKGEGEFEGRHRRPNGGAVAPRLAEDGCFAVRRDGIKEGLAVISVHSKERREAQLQCRTFLIGDGVLINAWVFSKKRGGDEEFAVRRDVGDHAAAVK